MLTAILQKALEKFPKTAKIYLGCLEEIQFKTGTVPQLYLDRLDINLFRKKTCPELAEGVRTLRNF